METPVLVAIVGLLAIPLGALLNWVLSRRKSVADIYNSIAEAGQAAVESVSTALETVRRELDDAHRKIDILVAENVKLHDSINDLKMQNERLLEENLNLKNQVTNLTSTLQQLVTYEQEQAASVQQFLQHDSSHTLFRSDESPQE